MRIAALLVLGLLCLAGKAEAQASCAGATLICTATTNSMVNVQTAINTAEDGDTVIIPTGAVTWQWTSTNCSLTNPVSACGRVRIQGKGIHLKGSPGLLITHLSATILDARSALRVQEDTTHSVRVSDLTFRETNNDYYLIEVHSGGSGGKPVLLHNNTCQGINCARFVRFYVDRGVVYLNTMISTVGASVSNNRQFVSCKGSQKSWESLPTYGTEDVNGTFHLYVEDNDVRSISETIDIDDGCRMVVRHNTILSGHVGSHGQDTSFIGCRYGEVYGNTFGRDPANNNSQGGRYVGGRGCSWRIHHNTSPNITNDVEFGAVIYSLSERRYTPQQYWECWGSASNLLHGTAGTNNFAGFQYPAPHQVALGWNGGSGPSNYTINGVSGYVIEGYYYWSNSPAQDFGLRTVAAFNCTTPVDAQSGYIQVGRDVFNSQPAGYHECDTTWGDMTGDGLGCEYPHPCRVECNVTQADGTPVVTITVPGSEAEATTSAITTFTGTASDDVAVTAVTWANSLTGGSGSATGTTSWTIASIALDPGLNPITVTASDGSAPNGTDLATVFYDECGTTLPYTNAFALYADATAWSTLGPCFSHYGSGSRYQIIANKASSVQGGTFDCEVYTGQTLPPDQYVSATVGALGQVRLGARISGQAGSNSNLYALLFNVGLTNLWLGKYDGPNGLIIYSTGIWDGQYTPVANTSTARLEVEGITARAYLDVDGVGAGAEVLLGAVNISDFQNSNGLPGVCLVGSTASFDDLEIGIIEPEPPDIVPPVVTIDAPTDPTETEDTELAIGGLNGTATDETELDRCEVENDRDPGVVALTLLAGDWENAGALALSIGVNVFTVRCYDATGNNTAETVNVIRNEPDPPPVSSGKKRFRL
jgi:hypothetical protein